MKILLVYPEKDNNTRNLFDRFGLNLRRKNADPLELIEISIELPITWERKLVDLNKEKLHTKDIQWADIVVVKARENQMKSAIEVSDRCNAFQKKIIVQSDLNESPVWSTNNNAQPNFSEALENIIDTNTLEKFLEAGVKKRRALESLGNSLPDFSARLRKRLQIITD